MNNKMVIPNENSFKIGVNSVFKLSKFIKNPFDALCLLIDGYNRMKYR